MKYKATEEITTMTEDTEPSQYLRYLPAIFSEDEFTGRFLKIFESMLTPIERVLDQIHLYFDPKMAPEGLLHWLATWVDLVLDEKWSVEKRRQMIGAAVELYQLRGTRRGLTEYLRIYTGVTPLIVEHFGGIRLGEDSELGWNTVLGGGRDHCFTVILEIEDTSAIDLRMLRAIIEAEKPAHAAYDLVVGGKADLRAFRDGSY